MSVLDLKKGKKKGMLRDESFCQFVNSRSVFLAWPATPAQHKLSYVSSIFHGSEVPGHPSLIFFGYKIKTKCKICTLDLHVYVVRK